jgi:hypothetical protein
MGNCACECLQDQDNTHQIEVNTGGTYHKDYTQPGAFKGGNQFLLLDNSDTEDRDNRLKFQTTKEQRYAEYKVDTVDPERINGDANNQQQRNDNEELREQDVDIIIDDNRVQYHPEVEAEAKPEEEEEVICASTTVKNDDNLTKKSKVQTYNVNTYKHYQESIKKPDNNVPVDTLRSENEGNYYFI